MKTNVYNKLLRIYGFTQFILFTWILYLLQTSLPTMSVVGIGILILGLMLVTTVKGRVSGMIFATIDPTTRGNIIRKIMNYTDPENISDLKNRIFPTTNRVDDSIDDSLDTIKKQADKIKKLEHRTNPLGLSEREWELFREEFIKANPNDKN